MILTDNQACALLFVELLSQLFDFVFQYLSSELQTERSNRLCRSWWSCRSPYLVNQVDLDTFQASTAFLLNLF